jgi:hypothetical protein
MARKERKVKKRPNELISGIAQNLPAGMWFFLSVLSAERKKK